MWFKQRTSELIALFFFKFLWARISNTRIIKTSNQFYFVLLAKLIYDSAQNNGQYT